jgi:hypothetical protein
MLGFGALGEFALGEISRALITPPPPSGGQVDASTIPPARTVNFGGGTNRVDFGGGTNRVDF